MSYLPWFAFYSSNPEKPLENDVLAPGIRARCFRTNNDTSTLGTVSFLSDEEVTFEFE